MKVIDKQNRNVLIEGRNNGVSYAFLKKLTKDTFETVIPVSPCKDYLNDVVYCEHLDVSLNACGLNYKKVGIFDNKTSYLTAKVLGTKSNTTLTANNQTEASLLKKNYKNIQHLLNWIEDTLKISPLTEITEANDDHFVISLPHYWSSSTYLISLYTLILRMSIYYDGSTTPSEFLNDFTTKFSTTGDSHSWRMVFPRFILLMKGYKLEQTFDKTTGSSIHNMGILNYTNFKL